MTFISLQFLLFLGIVVVLYYICPKKIQWLFLLLASYTFYFFSGITPLLFVVSSTCLVYLCGVWMKRVIDTHKKKSEAKKINKRILLLAVFIEFGVLLVLKYYNFIAENLNSAFSVFAYDGSLPLINLILPLGISFYTFQAVGYLIDIYRNKYQAEVNPLRLALFLSFFPQVIQGPISRYDNLGTQLKEYHYFSYQNLKYGAQLMLWGYFKKLVIADSAGALVSQVFGHWEWYDSFQIFIAIVVYALQIYADFSGGIDMARGAAQIMGIDLIDNFKRPYFGTSVAEYWRRWHMSLTNWMRDYVFFPLTLSKTSSKIGKWGRKHIGGTIGKQISTYIPTFVTFFLIGIWHGAGWGFIVYGLYNATIIVVSMVLTPGFTVIKNTIHLKDSFIPWKIFQILRTFLIMAIGKCITRADSVPMAFGMLRKCCDMFFAGHMPFDYLSIRMASMGLNSLEVIALIGGVIVFFCVSLLQENGVRIRETVTRCPLLIRWILYLALIGAVLVLGHYGSGYSASDFVYRNF